MVQRLTNNNNFFKNMKNKIREDSVLIIQRYWRSIAIRFRKYRNAIKMMKYKKKLRILLRWSRYCKSNKKPKGRRFPSKPQNLDIPESNKKSMTSDISAVKFVKATKRRMTNIKGNFTNNNLLIIPENLINVITKGSAQDLLKQTIKTPMIDDELMSENNQEKVDDKMQTPEDEAEKEGEESEDDDKGMSHSDTQTNPLKEAIDGEGEDLVPKETEDQLKNKITIIKQDSEIIISNKCLSPRSKEKEVKNPEPRSKNAEPSSILNIESEDQIINQFNAPKKKPKYKKSKKNMNKKAKRMN